MSRDATDNGGAAGQVGNQGPVTVRDVVGLLEEAIQAGPGQVKAETPLQGLAGWDSMGMVAFIWLVDQRTGVKLVLADLRKSSTPAALARLIHDRLPG
jgi:acyl carrier protein